MDRRHFLTLLACAASAEAAPGTARPWLRLRLRAARYLAGRQSDDGAWRSDVYGSFKSGTALTPLVALAIRSEIPGAAAKAAQWILAQRDACWSVFPVHNAGWLLEGAGVDPVLAPLRGPLVDHLRGLQFGSTRGWTEDQPAFGGWSYAGEAPAWQAGLELAPMQQPNLSATVLAVAGLRAAGFTPADPVLQDAAIFIRRCQNFAGDGVARRFDDGGFFQISDDASRNKAGRAGTDAAGAARFQSYCSATADGLRGLLMTGAERDGPRVNAAVRWLEENPALDDVPDLAFYAAYARAEAGRLAGHRLVPHDAPDLVPGLSIAQGPDGSVVNTAGEMRENDPLVATSLALMAGR